jgi:hypothetical protein
MRAQCPCNLSRDHGATYDFCRVSLVFNIREGDVEGTDIGGLKVALIADTPKVMADQPVRFDGMFHPVGSDLTMAEAKRSRISCVRHRVRGEERALEAGVLLRRLSACSTVRSGAVEGSLASSWEAPPRAVARPEPRHGAALPLA